ncbi:MAG: hypothetical protein ACTSP6_12075 [Promethearchaeota archaeon]
MPIGIFLYEIDQSFGPNVLADYYITKDKPSTEILKDFAEKHVKKDLADASARDEKFRYYSSIIEGKDIKKNTFIGFMLRLEEDIVSLKSIFEKIEERVVTNFSQDKKKLQSNLKGILNSILSLMEKLKEPKIIKETINEKTKKLLDEGKLQEARELIELIDKKKIPEKLSQEVKLAEDALKESLYKKSRKNYLKAAALADQVRETEMALFLRKKGNRVGDIPDIIKTREALCKAIKKGLEELQDLEFKAYEDTLPLIDKNIKLSNSLEDNESFDLYEKLYKSCYNASRRASDLNKLNKEIKNMTKKL